MYNILLYTQTHIYAYTYTHMRAHKTKTYLFVIIHNIYILCPHEVLSSI